MTASAPEIGPTPIFISPRVRIVLVLLALAALVLLFWQSSSLLPLLMAGATVALILSFPVRLLARSVPRGVAIALVFIGLLLLLVLGLLGLVPLVIIQLKALIEAAPQLADNTESTVLEILQALKDRGLLAGEPSELVDSLRQGLIERAQSLAQQALSALVGSLSSVVDTAFDVFGVLFIAIYLLSDIRRFEDAVVRAAPDRYRRDARALWNDLGRSLSCYLSGLLVSLAIQGVLAYLVNLVLDVPYAVLLGLLTAVTGVLPYFGAWISAIPAVILAFFVSPSTAVLCALGYVALQQLEGQVLTPRIQGNSLKVHPLLVFLAIIAAWDIDGMRGAIFAVPVLAMLRVLYDFFAARLRVRRPDAPPVLAAASPPGPPADPHPGP
ncbi:MAG: AI-2E family transporter [Chloroflexi bacterium]|nr:AI-2E family transporter [Chloroflexota bacterium]